MNKTKNVVYVDPDDNTTHWYFDVATGEMNAFYVLPNGKGWEWNGDFQKPTVSPSILNTKENFRNHVFIRDGKIQYLNDCTHNMAGQTVDMVEVENDKNN